MKIWPKEILEWCYENKILLDDQGEPIWFHENKLELKNGSIIQLSGTDNEESVRGLGIKGCLYEDPEYLKFLEKAQEVF